MSQARSTLFPRLLLLMLMIGLPMNAEARIWYFDYRLDSWQHFGEPGYVAKVFRRNQEFGFGVGDPFKPSLYLAYEFTAEVDGITAIHEWSPITCIINQKFMDNLELGTATPFHSALGQPSIAFTRRSLMLNTDLKTEIIAGYRLHNRSLILQPVITMQFNLYLSARLNGGRMVEFLLDQEPQLTLRLKAPRFPLETSLIWQDQRLAWQVSVWEQWRF